MKKTNERLKGLEPKKEEKPKPTAEEMVKTLETKIKTLGTLHNNVMDAIQNVALDLQMFCKNNKVKT